MPLKKICKLDPEIRWYYNKTTDQCGIFMYTGCKGDNNFEEEKDCIEVCGKKNSTSKAANGASEASTIFHLF